MQKNLVNGLICQGLVLLAFTGCVKSNSNVKNDEEGNFGNFGNFGGECNQMYQDPILAEVFFEIGSDMKDTSLELISGSEKKEIKLSRIEGTRTLVNGVVKSTFSSANSLEGEAGNYQIALKRAGQVLEQKSFTLTQVGCDLEGGRVTFEVKAAQSLTLDPTKEYYPINEQLIIVRDPSTGAAQSLDGSKTWQSTEVIRFITYGQVNGQAVSMVRKLERDPQGKSEIGRFREEGVKRADLPTPETQIEYTALFGL